MYCPIIPIQKSCTPPINVMIHAVDAHPVTGSPKTSFRIIIKITATKDNTVMNIPNQDANANGACEKLIIPSIAYLNSFQKFHFVSPATRFTFSYGSQHVRNPIQPKIPLEKRLYSPISTIASTISRRISRKSRAPSTISASDTRLIIR